MLSNTATPKYYGEFRAAVMRGEIAVNRYISMEMNRIDDLIRNPGVYYDENAMDGFVKYCEAELTLTNGDDLHLLDTFKLWAEQVFCWYYFVERSVYVPPDPANGIKGHYEKKMIKKRLVNKQYLIIPRGAAKSMYDYCIQAFYLCIDQSTTHQITVAPTMKQAEEVMSPFRTAIARARGPLFQFLTEGSLQNTTGSRANRQKLASTKKGIENFLTNSILEIRPMSIDKLQGLRCKIATVDEWLSGDIKEDVIGCIEQGASKLDDYLIIATSSEGTVRNGPGDTIKMELLDILKGQYVNPHVSIWYYTLDDIKEINDILAKRFNIPMEGYTYFFTYDETKPHRKQEFWSLPCALGADLSQGDDFCAFTFLFPLSRERFGIKARSYITSLTLSKLPSALRLKYEEFISEGTLIILEGTVLDMMEVYDDLDKFINDSAYDVRCFGFDPYNAQGFVERWSAENGAFGVTKVIQGARTESVPLGEIKKLSEERLLIFDQEIMSYTMGNCITLEDTNGNRKLFKQRHDEKIDNVAALMDAYVAYKSNREAFI